METILVADTTNAMEAVTSKLAGVKIETQKKNRIQVSNTKKPLFFYLNLAKRYIKQHNDVELSALGMAIPTVVIIAEILKSTGLATEKKVLTSTIGSKDDAKGRVVQKAKIEIVLEKSTENAEKETTDATATEKEIEIVPEKTEKAEKETTADTEADQKEGKEEESEKAADEKKEVTN